MSGMNAGQLAGHSCFRIYNAAWVVGQKGANEEMRCLPYEPAPTSTNPL